jgi:ribonucleoside-diphosphate reductase alpha chain
LQFIPGYREANLAGRNQPELSLPGLMDEAKKKINRPVPDLALSDDSDILLQPAPLSATNGNSNGHGNGDHAQSPVGGRVVTSLSQSVSHFQLDAPTCPNCGHVAVRNGACYKCLNCGESLGCS